MKAVQFKVSVPRYIFCKLFGKISKSVYYGPFSMLKYVDIPEPQLTNMPNEEWVKIQTKLSGFCGSELNTIFLHDSPSLTPWSSSPFIFGHENCGLIEEKGKLVKGFEIGDRVTVNPMLPCRTRGFEKVCELCERGQFSSCLNFTKGNIAPGLDNFTCRDTGGGWSPYFLAHQFQLYHVPDAVSDEDAMLVEPFSSALHNVMKCYPKDTDTILIIGAGMIGIGVLAALRALDCKARIIVLAKYKFQGEICEKYGADEIIYLREGDYYDSLAKSLKVELQKPALGKRVPVDGGADIVYECVGTDFTMNDALRFTKPGGKLGLIGLVGNTKKVDWSFAWFKELTLYGTNTESTEIYQGESIPTFQLVLNWLAEGKIELKPLLTHKFKLVDYKKAIKLLTKKGGNNLVKLAFNFD
ncbi:MAG TPA: alcohol dehydrogenase catalytic domain-containing protein [Candidatus Deferrimicrobium sp.]|nr:alcohol dehydrogenase catalytic domain-containing protein [Candidatus Deferrimicrobium sp.]